MQEKDEQARPAETFNQDQQEMFQNPDTNLGDTRPRTPGTQNAQPPADVDKAADAAADRKLDNPDLL